MLGAGIVFDGVCVCLCVLLHKILKILFRNWCSLVGERKARSVWTLKIIDIWPWELFTYFAIHAVPFEWLDLATLFSVWGYISRLSRTHSSFNFQDHGDEVKGHSSEKALARNSKVLIRNWRNLINAISLCWRMTLNFDLERFRIFFRSC